MKLTLGNGLIVEGTLGQIQEVARSLNVSVPSTDDGIHYNSSTKGLILISGMETNHLRNALLRRYADFVAGLRTKGNLQVVNELANPSDKTLVGLMAELTRRGRQGRL